MSTPNPFEALDIVVVDDNAQMIMLYRTVLRGLGVGKIRAVRTVDDALYEMRLHVPDMVITDWEMQPVNGLDFVRKIRGQGFSEYRLLPILMVTTHADIDRIQMAREAGITGYLAKPISGKLLGDRILAALKRARPAAAPEPEIKPEVSAAADAELARLKEMYESWLPEELDRLRNELAAARNTAGSDRAEHLKGLFRIAHDLKGQGSSFDYPLITRIGNSLCRFIEKLVEPQPRDFDVMAAHVDALGTVVSNRIRGEGGAVGRTLADRLEALAKRTAGPRPGA